MWAKLALRNSAGDGLAFEHVSQITGLFDFGFDEPDMTMQAEQQNTYGSVLLHPKDSLMSHVSPSTWRD